MKTDPVARAPRPPGRRGSHWGTLAALGQVSPHWGRLLTCPNDPLPTPNAPLPAPMTRCLPQMHCHLPQLYGCLPQCGSSPLHDRTTALPAALQPCSRMPPSPPSPCGPVPASIDGSSSGFCGKWFRPLSFLFLRVGSALASARRRPVRGGGGRSRTSGPGPQSSSRPRRDRSTNPHARTGAHCG